jgi:hypothetical protein
MSSESLIPPLLKAGQVALMLNISRALAYRLMQTGEIQTVKIQGSRRVCPDDLKRYIQEHKSKNGKVGIQ